MRFASRLVVAGTAFVLPYTLAWAAPAQVDHFTPLGTVKRVRQVTARFTEPMVPFGNPIHPVEPFDIHCSESGKGRWADPRNWVYDFDRDLPAGVKCSFDLKSDVKTVDGNALTGDRSFTFSTGGPAVLWSDPYQGSAVDEAQIFLLHLDAPAEAASVEKHASFTIEGIAEKVGATIVTGKERDEILETRGGWRRRGKSKNKEEELRKTLLLKANRAFPTGAKVTLTWGAGITAPSGGVATEEDQLLQFTAREPFTVTFSCERENAEAACLPITSMELRFNATVSWKLASQIRLKGPKGEKIEPAKPTGAGDTENGVVWVSFPAPFEENAKYVVELPSGMVDDAGRALSNAAKFPLEVKTDRYPPLAKFAAPFGILESKGDPALLPVTLRNLEPEVAARLLHVKKVEENVQTVNVDTEHYLRGKARKIRLTQSNVVLDWIKKVENHDREKPLFAEDASTEGVSEFKVPKPGGKEAFEVVGIPFKEPGFYVVELRSDILGRALLDKQQAMYVPAAVLVTNLAVHFKWGRESSLVWVTSLDEGKPVADAEVYVRDCAGNSLWNGKTDAKGVARIDELPDRNRIGRCPGYHSLSSGLMVTAKLGDDFSFVHSSWDKGIEEWRFKLPYASHSKENQIHTVFDRSLFRAGETVSMKHLIREDVMAGFGQVPQEERPTMLRIDHLGSGQHYDQQVSWKPNGSAESTWKIPKEAKLGTYSVSIGGHPSGTFKVEEFRVPLMRGHVQGPGTPLVKPAEYSVDVAVQYLAGGGAGGQTVKLRRELRPKYVSAFEGFEGFTFANGPVVEGKHQQGEYDYYSYYEPEEEQETPAAEGEAPKQPGIETQQVTLDATGGAHVKMKAPGKLEVPMEAFTEVEFRDPSGQSQTVAASIPLWPSNRIVGIEPDSWAVSKDKLKFTVGVVDLKGAPVADAQVDVKPFQKKVYSHRKRLVGGFYAYESYEETKAVGETICTGKTDSHGKLSCEVAPPAQGEVILQASAKDEAGNATVAHREVWVAGDDEWWFGSTDSDRIDLIPEKLRYEPGETARFQVRMPFREATALVTYEREGVIDTEVVHLSGKAPVIEVPVKPAHAPNVFVSALVVRGRVGEPQPTALVDLGKPAYKLGIAEIKVGWKGNELKVHVEPQKGVYKVREKALVKIHVEPADGTAIAHSAEVAVAAVDEGLLELAPNKSWDLLEAMMGRRGHAVETSTAQMQVIGKRHFGLKALPHGGGGGKRTTRELFDTLLFWKPAVLLDANGDATVEIPLNDSLTSFKIVAVATAGTSRFGTGSSSIRSSQDLMLLPGVPQLAREGDRFRAEVTARNTTDHPMDIAVTAKVTGLSNELATQKGTLAAGEARELAWDISVPVGTASLAYLFDANEKGGASDRLRIQQSVIPAVPERTFQGTITQINGKFEMPVERPEKAIPGRGGVHVTYRAKIGDGLSGVTEYMLHYPYSCLEQRISTSVALRDKQAWDRTMQLLPTYLDSDGLAKYFPAMTWGSDTLTAYLLSIGKVSGWEIPTGPRQRMIAALLGFVEGTVQRWEVFGAVDLPLRKIAALEAVSRWQPVDAAALTSVRIEPNLWPTGTVLAWRSLLTRLQGYPEVVPRLKEADQILRARLNFQGTEMAFSTEGGDFLDWLMTSIDTNAVKLVLETLDAPAWNEDMPRIVRGALGRQRHGHWDTTTANAWGVLAMEKFSEAFEKVPVDGGTDTRIGDTGELLSWSAYPDGKTVRLGWPEKKANLVISHDGDGKPWATIQSIAALPLDAPISTGYKVTKTWTAVERKDPAAWTRGDVIRVKLEVDAQADKSWVVINDPIPAGSSILGGMGTDSKLLRSTEKMTGWFWPAYEERAADAYRAYYEFVTKGKFSIEYTLRLNQDGFFNLPPTRVEAMYAPEMFGEIPNASVEVKP